MWTVPNPIGVSKHLGSTVKLSMFKIFPCVAVIFCSVVIIHAGRRRAWYQKQAWNLFEFCLFLTKQHRLLSSSWTESSPLTFMNLPAWDTVRKIVLFVHTILKTYPRVLSGLNITYIPQPEHTVLGNITFSFAFCVMMNSWFKYTPHLCYMYGTPSYSSGQLPACALY